MTSNDSASDVVESSPIADEIEAELKSSENDETEHAPETAKSVKIDVQRAISRETQDGPGDEDPGPSDWVSYATEGVEVEDEE